MKNYRHLKHWGEIMHGGEVSWESLFKGYQSSTDWPVAAYYRELMEVYPEAKIILTVRNPERWHKSIVNTIYRQEVSPLCAHPPSGIPVLRRFLKYRTLLKWGALIVLIALLFVLVRTLVL